MGGLRRDLRYAARSAARNPGFTALAVLLLGLGIGATTAIFSVVNAVLLRSLPYAEAERIVRAWGNSEEGDANTSLRVVELKAFEEATAFKSVGADFPTGITLTHLDGETERIEIARITSGYFDVFGIRPALGRLFTEEEVENGADLVAIVSDGFWRRRMGSDPNAIGSTVTLDDLSFTVTGVLPRDFRPLAGEAEAYIPYSLGTSRWIGRWLNVYGKLKPGSSVARATEELNLFMNRLGESEPRTTGWWVSLETLYSNVVGQVRPALLALVGAVAFVLLIACVNVANLTLARASSRENEIAVRMALGASRFQIVRQVLVESLVLAGIGGALGIFIAYLGVDALVALAPPEIPRLDGVSIDGTVLAVTLGVSIIAGVLSGTAPAFHTARGTPGQSLRTRSRGASAGNRAQRILGGLVVSEIALSLTLLIAAGLVMRSFVALQGVETGFERENSVAMQLTPPSSKYPEAHDISGYYQSVIDRLVAIPGIQAAGIGSDLPLGGRGSWMGTNSEERWQAGRSERIPTLQRVVNPTFFNALGVPLLEGRVFDFSDGTEGPLRLVINETLASRLWPGESAVGKRLTSAREPGADSWREVIGVVGNLRYQTLKGEPEPQAYELHSQRAWNSMFLFVRGAGRPEALLEMARGEVSEIDPGVPVSHATTLAQVIDGSLATPRFNLLLFGLFGIVALGLALAGIYGVLSFSASQRNREIGIRMALGAQPEAVVGLVLRRGLLLLVVGAALGVGGSLALTRVLESLLYGVSPTDPGTFLGMLGALALTVVVASYLPARRASRINPSVVLREG